MGAVSRPCRDYPSSIWLTRQFLPGYFHSPLPGLNRGSPLGIAMLSVVQTYPRLRQARQELGYAYYLQKRYDASRKQFEALQDINPDDLSAHDYLSLIYGQIHMQKEAAREGAAYAEHQEDRGAALLALDWRYRHPDVAHEIEPYHVHEEQLPGKK